MNLRLEQAYAKVYENTADLEKMILKGHLQKILKVIESDINDNEKVQMISNLYKMFIKPEELEK